MKNDRLWIVLAGLACLVFLLVASASSPLQAQAQTVAFTNAAIAEVRDAHGQAVLRGEFVVGRDEDEDDDADDDEDDDADENERTAALLAVGNDTDAVGQAEVEVSGDKQEIEFSVDRVQPGATFTFVIDGVQIGTARANRRGHVEIDRTIRLTNRR